MSQRRKLYLKSPRASVCPGSAEGMLCHIRAPLGVDTDSSVERDKE
jgi:hypothetical protein